jgi:hypothetical protein
MSCQMCLALHGGGGLRRANYSSRYLIATHSSICLTRCHLPGCLVPAWEESMGFLNKPMTYEA